MPEFTFEALNGAGQRSTGTLTANSEREAAGQLDARGLFPVRIQPASANGAQRFGFSFGRRFRGRFMATFYAQLADLLHSGVPLLRSLDLLERQAQLTNQAFAAILREVRAKVADGSGLAQSMAAYPQAFNELAISMVRAGQEGGFMEDVLRRIADFTEQQEDLKAKVVGALAYPVFLAGVGSLVLFGLVIFVVPRFGAVFDNLRKKGELPVLTKYLMAFSDFVIGNWWWLAFVVAGVVFSYLKWRRSPRGRYLLDSWKLRVPTAGTIFLNLSLSRFTRILGTLLRNGIPILSALRIAKDSTGNRVLSDAIEQSAEHIKAGDKLATPLAACKYFPRDVVEMVAVAEESNNLENVLVGIADSLEKRTSRQLELFVRLLEPLMLLVMAGVTLMVVAGLLLPVFKMNSVLR